MADARAQTVDYLEGAKPYPQSVIEEYTRSGLWLNLTYGDLLDRATEQNPNKTAVIDERVSLTYAELRQRVDQFAIALLSVGTKKNDRVVIQLPNRHEFLVAYYGAQRIGAVPVLAMPRMAALEMSAIFDLTRAVAWVILVNDGKRNFFSLVEEVKPNAKSLEHVIFIGEEEKMPPWAQSMAGFMSRANPSDYPPGFLNQFRPEPNDVAHILLTGGTTGRSKAVPRTYNSFLTNVRFTNADASSDDVFIAATPVGHTMAHQGAVGAFILNGATLVMIEDLSPREILGAVQKYGVTRLGVVPTQAAAILAYPDLASYDLGSLKKFTTAGSALSPEHAAAMRELCARIGARSEGGAYGSSEGPSAVHEDSEPEEAALKSVGRPLTPGDRWVVLNAEGSELPANETGELATKGPTVFTGYYGPADEAMDIFTPDGYYKTGDLGKIDENGYIYITGRKKDVIQRGAEGIVPVEIEELLCSHPAVEKAAVVGMPDAVMGEKACAYVVLKNGENLTFAQMIDFFKEKGAGVRLWPERLEILEDLPVNNVGKINKMALREDIAVKLKHERQ